jgi:hypothetical protein
VDALGNSLVAETHRGGIAPVRAKGRAVRRGSTVAEALRRASVALRWAYDVSREKGVEDEPVNRGRNGGEGAAHRRKGWWRCLQPNSVVRRQLLAHELL